MQERDRAVEAPSLRPFRRVLPIMAGLALVKLAVQLATLQGYGWFRDEFYYLACARRLAFGYVDQPPLSLLVLRGVIETFGDSLVAVRFLPALVGGASVFVVGALAWRLGGGRFAVALAQTAALVAPVYLGTHHIWSMNMFEPLLWAGAALLVAHIAAMAVRPEVDAGPETGAPPVPLGLWLGLGVLLGLGLQNKISVLWLGFGLAVGLLLTPLRRTLTTPGPWLAGGLALVIFSPYVVWQVQHDWATLEFMRNATQQKMTSVDALGFVRGQLRMMTPGATLVWLAGLAWLMFARAGRPFRILGYVYLTVFALLMFSGSSRSGYLAAGYTWLLAAGGVAVEGAFRDRLSSALRRRAAGTMALAAVVIAGAVFVPFGLPVLPVPTYVAYAETLGIAPSTAERKELGALPQWYADMHGWQAMVDTVAAVYDGLPAADRQAAVIFGGNYGEAGAVDLLGRRLGLPAAVSNHNNYWLWGPGSLTGDEVLIVLGASREGVERYYDQVEEAAIVDCGHCMPYENNRPVFVARGLKMPVDAFWSDIKNFD